MRASKNFGTFLKIARMRTNHVEVQYEIKVIRIPFLKISKNDSKLNHVGVQYGIKGAPAMYWSLEDAGSGASKQQDSWLI